MMVDKGTTFYLTVEESQDELDIDDAYSYETLEHAMSGATECAGTSPNSFWVYECRPVRRVYRHGVAVDDMTTPGKAAT